VVIAAVAFVPGWLPGCCRRNREEHKLATGFISRETGHLPDPEGAERNEMMKTAVIPGFLFKV